MNWLVVFMAILLISGSYMLYRAIEENEEANILLKSGVETDAIVIENVKDQTHEGSSYRPKFEYHDRFGSTRNALGDMGSNPPAYSVGEKVRLVYNPNDFDQVKVKSYWGLHGATVMSLLLGIAHFSVSAIYFRRKILLAFTATSRP